MQKKEYKFTPGERLMYAVQKHLNKSKSYKLKMIKGKGHTTVILEVGKMPLPEAIIEGEESGCKVLAFSPNQ